MKFPSVRNYFKQTQTVKQNNKSVRPTKLLKRSKLQQFSYDILFSCGLLGGPVKIPIATDIPCYTRWINSSGSKSI